MDPAEAEEIAAEFSAPSHTMNEFVGSDMTFESDFQLQDA